jgi:hypothetical protein
LLIFFRILTDAAEESDISFAINEAKKKKPKTTGKRGPNWTNEEDRILAEAVRLHGWYFFKFSLIKFSKWNAVANVPALRLRGASALICARRWKVITMKHAQKVVIFYLFNFIRIIVLLK